MVFRPFLPGFHQQRESVWFGQDFCLSPLSPVLGGEGRKIADRHGIWGGWLEGVSRSLWGLQRTSEHARPPTGVERGGVVPERRCLPKGAQSLSVAQTPPPCHWISVPRTGRIWLLLFIPSGTPSEQPFPS